MFLAEQDRARDHQIHEGGTEAAGEAGGEAGPVAGADQVDVGLPVDLAAAEEEQVDAALVAGWRGGGVEDEVGEGGGEALFLTDHSAATRR